MSSITRSRVKDQPKPVSKISRNSVKDQVTPERKASPGTRQRGGGAEGIRTPDLLTASQTRYQLRHSPLTQNHSTKPVEGFRAASAPVLEFAGARSAAPRSG